MVQSIFQLAECSLLKAIHSCCFYSALSMCIQHDISRTNLTAVLPLVCSAERHSLGRARWKKRWHYFSGLQSRSRAATAGVPSVSAHRFFCSEGIIGQADGGPIRLAHRGSGTLRQIRFAPVQLQLNLLHGSLDRPCICHGAQEHLSPAHFQHHHRGVHGCYHSHICRRVRGQLLQDAAGAQGPLHIRPVTI